MCIYNEFQASLFYQKDINSNSVLMCAGASSYVVEVLAKIRTLVTFFPHV